MSALADFHFLRPLALLLLLALPLFWYAWRHGRSDAGAWRAAVDAHLLPHLIERIDAGPGRAGLVLATLLWTLACIALAGPAWEREPMPLFRNQAARVLALELAPTMLAQDAKPNRLERARYKLGDLLARSRDYQTALIGYAGDAFVAAPLTDDIGTVKNLVDALDPSTMPVLGNASGRAIDAAVALIEQAGLHRGEIILLADGISADGVSAARKAHARGFDVSVLGIGSAAGAPVPLAQGDFLKDDNGNVVMSRLDENAMRQLATAGGGRYAALSADASDLDALLSTHIDVAAHSSSDNDTGANSARWLDRGPWLLLLLLPLALAGFRRGWLMTIAFASCVSLPVSDLHAAALGDLWQRADQQTAAALASGDAKKAAEIAPTPAWHGSAAYRNGDYEAAATDYAKVDGADGAYNKGNALAKLGRYEDAIAAYDEALKVAPEMADAQANRKAVEDFLAQQKQQDQQGQQNKKNDKQDGGASSSKGGGEQSSADENAQKQDGGDSKNGEPSDAEKQDGTDKPKDGEGKDANAKPDRPESDAKAGTDAGAGADTQGKASGGTEQKPDAAQQKALSQAVDKALAQKGKADDGTQQKAVAPAEDDATREQRQALEHWLERVPDDPGGLLRRKFQLEYQRRQQRGGDGE
jgi:Ca-activated chloride channel family protein